MNPKPKSRAKSVAKSKAPSFRSPRADLEVREYIDNIFRVCYHDCSDSGHAADEHEHRFNALVDDKITIAQYIERYMLAEYAAALKEFAAENPDYNLAEPGCVDTPIPYEKVAPLLS